MEGAGALRSLTPRRRGNIIRLPSPDPRKPLRRLLAVSAVLVGVGAALCVTWRVNEVKVVGVQRVSVEEVMRAASLGGGERMLLTRLSTVADRVRAIPSIRDVRIERGLWASVAIHVEERVPLAELKGRPHLVVDAEGVIFDAGQGALPALSGWHGRPEAGAHVDPAAAAVLAAYADFPARLRERTAEIVVSDELTLAIGGGAKIRFGAPQELVRKAAAADAVLADASDRGLSLAYVDVRTPSTPVAREWELATPEPEPTPPPVSVD